MRRILITGFGGFIGYSLVQYLKNKFQITALDNFTNASNYDIKLARAARLGVENIEKLKLNNVDSQNVSFCFADICDITALHKIFSEGRFDLVIHLAAMTGVRQSLQNPQLYIDTNVKGFVNVLEAAKQHHVKHIIYASSSSVYGLNEDTPYEENQRTDAPISAYAASKKADELLANVYSHLYGLNITGLRFFTVYGPWTRPDMAAYIFMKAIADGEPIELFNEGKMVRDFTYVGDVVQSISLLADKVLTEAGSKNEIYNIGNHKPIYTIDFLSAIENAMNKNAIVRFKPMQPGDMPATNAQCEKLYNYIGFKPQTSIENGVAAMVKWFMDFYSVKGN